MGRAAGTATVTTPGGSYEVLVGAGLLDALDEVVGPVAGDRGWRSAVVVTDENVARLYLGGTAEALARLGLGVSQVVLPAGESSKDTRAALGVVDALASAGLTRSDVVVALGGGVVGDIAGFAAAVFKRGVDVLQVPTTLMAQVDSSIGGKTGVNLPAGKNLLGAFHQPAAVVSDLDTLATLPEREYRSGLAEVAKYWFLEPSGFSAPLEERAGPLAAGEGRALLITVTACASIKAGVVTADERESGPRAILNYGHTLGHALEAAGGYGGIYTHGEAVAVGMVFAACLSEALGLAEGLAARHAAALAALGLPTGLSVPAPAFEELEGYIRQDKKSAGDVRMVLLEGEGRPVLRDGLPMELLAGCYRRLEGG